MYHFQCAMPVVLAPSYPALKATDRVTIFLTFYLLGQTRSSAVVDILCYVPGGVAT